MSMQQQVKIEELERRLKIIEDGFAAFLENHKEAKAPEFDKSFDQREILSLKRA